MTSVLEGRSVASAWTWTRLLDINQGSEVDGPKTGASSETSFGSHGFGGRRRPRRKMSWVVRAASVEEWSSVGRREGKAGYEDDHEYAQ